MWIQAAAGRKWNLPNLLTRLLVFQLFLEGSIHTLAFASMFFTFLHLNRPHGSTQRRGKPQKISKYILNELGAIMFLVC